MGIVNITPDSFYDGGKSTSEAAILKQVEKMLKDGATFIDVGGYSSRPNAEDISVQEEIDRAIPAIELILSHFPDTLISIDTFRSEVARTAVESGAAMVNDISGGDFDSKMIQTVAELQVPYIIMHMRGTPKTMTQLTDYDNITTEVIYDLSAKIREARAAGINDIIVDPGFGFAKTPRQSFELLKNLKLLQTLEAPILSGVSRKSFIYKTLQITPQEALNGTTVMNTIAILNGSAILRVHDVKEATECIKLLQNLAM
ncbi:MAG: dihydropteroate synthase [Bacteroidetes bacterium]|jgi:dihydropteroate synthase|nr:dihydropteroate synthase [Bacteroidota bacterium]